MRCVLHNPELLTVRPIDREGTQVDEVAQEPRVLIARQATVQILAQVDEVRRGRGRPDAMGAEVMEVTTVTVKRADAARLAWTPTKGDRITAVADRRGASATAVNWYIKTDPHRSGKLQGSGRGQLIVFEIEARETRRRTTEL